MSNWPTCGKLSGPAGAGVTGWEQKRLPLVSPGRPGLRPVPGRCGGPGQGVPHHCTNGCVQGVKAVSTGGLVSLEGAFKGPNVISAP